jgi:hypothetical protein
VKEMRRWSTALIVVAVAALAVFAAADPLRGSGEPTARVQLPTITSAFRPTLREILRREAVTGFLLYSDDDCRLHSLLLPRLVDDVIREEGGVPFVRCRFETGGGRILEEGDTISPDGMLVAACRAGRVVVWQTESGEERRTYRGCPPAWRPDGSLTYPQGDRIMQGSEVLFSARELRDAAGTNPNVGNLGVGVRIFVHALDLVWLDEQFLITSLEVQTAHTEPQFVTVAFLGQKLLESGNFGQGTLGWVASPAGSFAAAEDASLVTRAGDFVEPPDNLPEGRAVTFSPDEQWLAYTSGVSIYLIGTPRNSEPGRIIQLPISAEDIVWEPAGIDTTGTSTAAR